MRKITRQTMSHFLDDEPFKLANTRTSDGKVWLHGNLIIKRTDFGYKLTMAGWATPTTVERLNGFLELLGSSYAFSSARGGRIFNRETRSEVDIFDSEWYDFDTWGNWITREVDFNAIS